MKIWKPEPDRWVVIDDAGALYDVMHCVQGNMIRVLANVSSAQTQAVLEAIERFESRRPFPVSKHMVCANV